MMRSELKAARRELRHIPVNLPRPGTPAERIFLDLWREYIARHPDALGTIFSDLAQPLDQRGARVAASFMVWMGCNDGMSFTFEAESLAETMPRRLNAFVAAWAIHTLRWYGTNRNVITTEAMLTPGGIPRRDGSPTGQVDWRRMVSPTQYDNDVLSCMVRWWATQHAREMREIAAPLIAAANRKIMSQAFGARSLEAADA